MSLPLYNVRAYLTIGIHGNKYLIGFIASFYINMSPIAGELEEISVTVRVSKITDGVSTDFDQIS